MKERVLKGATFALLLLLIASFTLSGCRLRRDSTPLPTNPPATEVITPTSTLPPPTSTPLPTPSPTSLPAPTPTFAPTPQNELVEVELGLQLPQGFHAEVFASRLTNPTSLTFGPDGTLYVSLESGLILELKDADSDGKADSIRPMGPGFVAPLGLAFHDGALYVSSRGSVHTMCDTDDDGEFDEFEEIIADLPVSGAHQNNGLAFGPDGMLYMNVGSTCNACIERDLRNATIMQFKPDGSDGVVYASGLRNVYDLAFHPEDGTLFAADNGRDDRGNLVPEELNLIVEGGDYGWPFCWGDGGGANCQGTIPPIAEMEPHSSADGLAFYTGDMFPSEYRNNIFIAMWGSLSGVYGRKVVRIELTKRDDTYDARVSEFALGLNRPLDLVVAPDGALMIADYGANAIYRVFYKDPTEDE